MDGHTLSRRLQATRPTCDPQVRVEACMRAAAALAGLWLAAPWLITLLPEADRGLVALGWLGVWRYSWGALHVGRAAWFSLVTFPRLRAAAEAIPSPFPARLYIMVLSFKEDPDVTRRVFTRLVEEAASIPSITRLVISVGRPCERDRIFQIVRACPGHERLELDFHAQLAPDGTKLAARLGMGGKRLGMGDCLRTSKRRFDRDQRPGEDLVVFMDGDTVLSPGTLRRTLGFFAADAELAALTTHDEGVHLAGSPVPQAWFDAKFARRHLQMQSHALSGHVLTLTGRFSVFRGARCLTSAFIDLVERDHIDHDVHGPIPFLMGDDKSTWFALIQQGARMLYVPDVTVHALESRPESFVTLSTGLMQRWFGNMLRTNGRALRLGPGRAGSFIWLCLLDQRISMWTTLVGPTCALLAAGLGRAPGVLACYAAWVLASRQVQLATLSFFGLTPRPHHVWLLPFDQWIGSILKIQAMCRLDFQFVKKNDAGEARDSVEVRQRLVRWRAAVWVLLFVSAVLAGLAAARLPWRAIVQEAPRLSGR